MVKLRNLGDAVEYEVGQGKSVEGAPLLQTRDLHFAVGDKSILHDVNLSVETGEVVAVVGPNGAGKSTLLKLLSSDLQPTKGNILLQGLSLSVYPARELAVRRAVMSQQALITFQFTAYEVAMMGRYPHQRYGHSRKVDDERIVQAALEQTETTHLKERLYPTLSGGEAARVTLARVLAQATPLLLLDEPTAALDLRHQQIVMQIAQRLKNEHQTAVLTIVHDINLAAAYADRVVMIHEGTVVAQGTPHEVLTEERLSAVFHCPVMVMPHPAIEDRPLIVPLAPG